LLKKAHPRFHSNPANLTKNQEPRTMHLPSPPLRLFLLVCLPALAFAADPPKKKKGPTPPTVDTESVALIKPYDKDKNFEISADELKAMQADYKAAPAGPLKVFDLEKDGEIDNVDRMGINNKLGAAKMVAKPEAPKKKKKP
jgi:hypothetical protein